MTLAAAKAESLARAGRPRGTQPADCKMPTSQSYSALVEERARWLVAIAATVFAAFVLAVGLKFFSPEQPKMPFGHGTTPKLRLGTPASEVPPVAVFIGDSWTSGARSTDGAGFVRPLANAERWNVVNLGVSGAGYIVYKDQDPKQALSTCGKDYCPMFPELISVAKRYNPDVIFVSGGRNNVDSPPDLIRSSIHRFYFRLRDTFPRATIYAVSPIWDDDPPPETLPIVATAVRRNVTTIGGTYLDAGEPLLGHHNWVDADGVHPNDRGYQAVAAAMERALKTASR
jgi:acyl-CoA thioesterase-1